MPCLLYLPLELLWQIADHLHPADLVSLMSANNYLYTALTSILHKQATQESSQVCPMHWAAMKGHAALVSLLVVLGHDPNIQCPSQNSALHYATSRSHKNTIITLVANGADIEACDSNGETPLHRAAVDGNVVSVRTLIECGADIHARTLIQDTPLHCAASSSGRWGACKRDRIQVVRLLLDAGADVLAEGYMGRRASYDTFGETQRILEEAERNAEGSVKKVAH
ncbi:hypothetical protein Q9L58_006256 [Maublancomyces gigas]|uniref:Uncharacterized protein n=1 Tax=Discina gigas TaxID=1032678 RepID=A0ABR3GG94_9PEZI